MFKVIKKQTRPSTSVQFWQGQNDPSMNDEFRNYFYETYVLTGKFISVTPSVSEDGLELTNTAIFNSEDGFTAVQTDPVVAEGMSSKAEAHMAANGITLTEISRETF